ncbi:YhgE/Pip family protein [Subtercola sp. PAMC28395]|uniref:YhgE/Pip family protein n=1 Tax=Subtercola sp. PAMC28395 TaxID=2846775 RepID=UPI001C0B2237|nr:YhgE/Pip family protein [Subtercola sp. PAMC28395]QWT24504.1 YhgE/Pip family protein [Subtercola sp. PAMC28395]
MKRLASLLKSPDTASRSRPVRMIALVLAVLTPLLVAGIAIGSVSGASAGASGRPNVPAAVVNLDTAVTTTLGGKQTTVAAGKLLTQQLLSSNTSGFSWTITDASAASAGLASGTYSAVVTIPSDFSAQYISSQGATPMAATLAVETNGSQSYVSGLLATALASNVQSALSTSLTEAYIKGLLGGFTQLNTTVASVGTQAAPLVSGAAQLSTGTASMATGMASADSGMQALSSGLTAISSAVDQLPKATADLNVGAQIAQGGTKLLTDGLAEMVLKQADIELRQRVLDDGFAALTRDLPTLTPAEVASRVADLQSQSASITKSSVAVGDDLDVAVLGTAALHVDTDLVAKGTSALAGSMPELASSVSAASSGADALASGTAQLSSASAEVATGAAGVSTGTTQLVDGVNQIAANIPTYTEAQQTTISTVVAAPITTTVTNATRTSSAMDAVAGVMVPIALWAGALALYLVLAPFTALALGSVASTWRIARRSLVPALLLAIIQAAVVLVGLALLGVTPGHRIGTAVFVVGASLAFVALHQGLVAMFGRLGRMLSLSFLALQVVAAGVLVPAAFSPSWFDALSGILPLSVAVTGLQALVTGGDVGGAISALVILAVIGAIGIALTLVAISRRRTVVLPTA